MTVFTNNHLFNTRAEIINAAEDLSSIPLVKLEQILNRVTEEKYRELQRAILQDFSRLAFGGGEYRRVYIDDIEAVFDKYLGTYALPQLPPAQEQSQTQSFWRSFVESAQPYWTRAVNTTVIRV